MRDRKKQNRGVSHSNQIVIVVSHLRPTYGLETLAIKLAQQLSSDYTVKILSLGDAGGISIKNVEIESLGRSLQGYKRLLSPLRLILNIHRYRTTKVVLVGAWVALPWLLLSNKRNGKHIVWEHSLLSEKFETNKRMKFLASVAKVLYPKARAVVAVSPFLRDDLIDHGHKNTVLIHNPLDPEKDPEVQRGRMTQVSNSLELLSIGSLNDVKRHDLTILAMKHLAPGARLTIIGEGPFRAQLENIVATNRLDDNVVFAGFLQKLDIEKLLSKSDVLVHSSRSETFGLVLVEAAQLGIPVVATANLAAEYLIPEYVFGQVVAPNSKDIADAVSNFTSEINADSERIVSEMIRARKQREQDFSVSIFKNCWVDCIKELDSSDHKY